MLSPVRLSSVCNARAPYSAGWNLRQCFYAIWYLGQPLTSTENFTEIVEELNARGVVKYSDFGPIECYISETVHCKIGGKLVVITSRKSYMSFQLVPKLVTLTGVMALILRYFTQFGSFRGAMRKSVRCRREKSSRLLSHLLMSFLCIVLMGRSRSLEMYR